MSKLYNKVAFKEWLPLIGLTFTAFIFNTSEIIPIGLLTDISTELKVTEAHAGLLITVYAWVVALMSLPLMLLVSKMENRKLLLYTVSVFIVSNTFSALSPGYATLMLSRIGVACSHAIFWSIASPLAVRIAPEGKSSTGLSMIVTGTSIAMIVGLPLGRIIGLQLGWRITFVCIAVTAFIAFLILIAVFPKVPSRNAISLRKLPALLENPALIGIYLLTFIMVTAHYTVYSYIEPFLGQVADLSSNWVTWTLTAFGISGILGSVLFSRYYEKSPYPFICFATGGIAVFLLLLRVSALSDYTVLALCVFWGIAMTAFNLAFQAKLIQLTPQATAIAMSVYSGIYNLGIGCGALAGGAVCADFSISYIGYIGGAIAVIGCVYCMKRLVKVLTIRP